MPRASRVQNPSVTLYAFHLRNNMTTGTQKVRDNAHQLWEQCVALGEQRHIHILKSLKSELRSYIYNAKDGQYYYNPANEDEEATEKEKPSLDDWLELVRKDPKSDKTRQLSFHSESRENSLTLMGEIYPLRIHDTYAVDLTLRYQETVDFAELQPLNPTGSIKASLGQTLLLFAKPVDVLESAYQGFANCCVAALCSDIAVPLHPSAVGQLFGSPLFEYDNYQQNPTERLHILVWLDSHPETIQRIGSSEAYHALLNLLCCRSKILFTYHQSRLCQESARELYSQLEQKVEQLVQPPEEILEQLKQWLKQTPKIAFQYAKYLRDIQDHRTTITTNAQNYASKLEDITTLSLPNDDLAFLQDFLNHSCNQFQEQIKVDLSYLTPGQNLFQQMTDTIRGLVEVQQAERDRALENTLRDNENAAQKREQKLQLWIALAGTGLAVSGISSQVLSQPIETFINHKKPDDVCPNTTLSICLLYSFLNVLIHVAIGVAAASFLGLIVWLVNKKSHRSSNSNG